MSWLAGLPDAMHEKIVGAGLAASRVRAEVLALAELWDRFVAAKWCGHSPLIALRHYAQVRPEDFARAAGRGGASQAETVAHQVAQNGPEVTGDEQEPSSGDTTAARSEVPVIPGASGTFRFDPTPALAGAKVGEWAQQDSNL